MDTLRWVLLFIGIGVFILIFLFSKKKQGYSSEQDKELHSDDSFDADFRNVKPKANDSLSLDELARDMRLDNNSDSIEKTFSITDKDDPVTDKASGSEEKLIIFYLLEKNNDTLKGSQILDALESAGMRYGDMKIFHYYDPDSNDQKNSVFSIANIEEPGWFDLVSISQVATPGIVMFMTLPGSMASIKAFDAMLEVMDKLVKALPLTLKDKKHDIVSQQTLSHLREEIVEFERKRSIARN